MDRQGALHVTEELDAGGVGSLHVLVVGYLQQIKGRKHASQVSVVDDEEISNFPGLDVDG